MWTQSLQQGFQPKLATVAKVLLFPTDAYAMGSKVYNIATDAWWVPSLPWHSSLTGQTCPELADLFTSDGLASRTRTSPTTPSSRSPTRHHLRERPAQPRRGRGCPATRSTSPRQWRGPLNYTSANAKTNPAPGVAITPPVGIQWQKGTTYALEAKVVDNTLQPLAKITGDLLPTFK